ncbi:MAG: PEP-CTERM sorting domain-containing protein [Gammaproteobacteria bacterium]|nr:PEP-CTERM sorting domain-containing protein [Gammaproteobacteria bacterium]
MFASGATAGPVTYNGVTFPQGDISFADEVVSFTLGTGGVTLPHQNPDNALGAPDYNNVSNCETFATDPAENCTFVSLGNGGELVLRFTDNALTGSGDDSFDLWIFEVGPLVEPTKVDISKDGMEWFNVGSVGGATAGIDIDAFGFGPSDLFFFVRLTDICSGGACTGRTAGADIDAVGAISTVAVSVPAPGPLALLGLAFGLLGTMRMRAKVRRPLQ